VPVAAARQAEVGATDTDPAVPLGRRQHRLDELPVGVLEGGALGERAVRLGDAAGERVTDLLEAAEVEDPRRPGGADPVRDVHPAEALGDEPGELPLEPADLATQLDAGESLIDLESFEHSRHDWILSRLEGRGGNP
jgi:hypothetical protein